MLNNTDENLIGAAMQVIGAFDRPHITPEYLRRELEISVQRAAEVVERLVKSGMLGERERPGYRILHSPSLAPAPAPAPSAATSPPADVSGAIQVGRIPHAAEEPAAVSAPAAPPAGERSDHFPSELALEEILVDPNMQVRLGLREKTVQEYARQMADEKNEFPAITVFYHDGVYRLADGHHRLAAARMLGRSRIAVQVRRGSSRDAVEYALRVNTAHGLPLTRQEKQAAALRMLSDPEWAAWSNEEIGRHCGLSGMTIQRIRLRHPNSVKVSSRKCRSRNGKVRTMKVSNLGRKPRSGEAASSEAPGASATDPAGIEASMALLLERLRSLLSLPEAVTAFAKSDRPQVDQVRASLSALLNLLPPREGSEASRRAA